MKEIVFVIGVGRSGTTLLQSMLHAHSEIHFGRESHFIKRFVYSEIHSGHTWKNADELEKALKEDSNLKEFSDQVSKGIGKCFGNKEYITPCLYLELLSAGRQEKYVGDKDPMNVNFLPEIKIGFPQARIIHIIRDPRDVIASRVKSGWGSGRSLLWHTAEYKHGLDKARREGPSLFGKNYREIVYEELVTNPEKVLREICDFLNLQFEDKMLTYYEEAGKLVREEEMKWKSNVLKPVDKSNSGKWRTQLSPFQVSLIESILQKAMKELNYIPEATVGKLEGFYYRLLEKPLSYLFKYRFG